MRPTLFKFKWFCALLLVAAAIMILVEIQRPGQPVAADNPYHYQSAPVSPPVAKYDGPLKDFTSLEELQAFVNARTKDDYTVILQPGQSGVVNFTDDCVPDAIALINYAQRHAYYLSLDLLTPDQYNQHYGQSSANGHMICMAVIGENIYFIDPPTGNIWLGALNGSLLPH
jgi:hypothetical protein